MLSTGLCTVQIIIRLQRAMTILSMCMNSSNRLCNAFQAINHFFLASVNTPEHVLKMTAKIGLSLAPNTGNKMITSLSEEHMENLPNACQAKEMTCIYDNLEFSFNAPQPTMTKQQSLHSVTSLTFSPLLHVDPKSLQCSEHVWQRSLVNYKRDPSLVYLPNLSDVTISSEQSHRLLARFQWHVKAILIQFHPKFKEYLPQLGSPPQGDIRIPVQKTTQIPGKVVDASESSIGGNIQVLDAIRSQGGVAFSKEQLTDKVVLVHGDLGTVERIEGAQQARSVELDPVNRLQWVLPVFGLPHLQMNAVEALRRIYLPAKAESRLDESSSYKHIAQLRPKEGEKFKSNPGFRALHDGLTDELTARILDCWRIIISQHTKSKTLAEWADTRP
jgi:hypothetical protein